MEGHVELQNQPRNPQARTPKLDYSQMDEAFSDVFEIHVNPWSAALTFGLRATKETESMRYSTRMRMPLEQAKALAVLLLRNIRLYEEKTQTEIALPAVVLQELDIPLEDWRRFSAL